MVLQTKPKSSGLPPGLPPRSRSLKSVSTLSSKSFVRGHPAGNNLDELIEKVAQVSKNVGKLFDKKKNDKQKQRLNRLRLGYGTNASKSFKQIDSPSNKTVLARQSSTHTNNDTSENILIPDLRQQFKKSKDCFSSSSSINSDYSYESANLDSGRSARSNYSVTSNKSAFSARTRDSNSTGSVGGKPPGLKLQRSSSLRSVGSAHSIGSSRSLSSNYSTDSSSCLRSSRSLVRSLSSKSLIEQIGDTDEYAITIKGVKPKYQNYPNQNVFLLERNFGNKKVALYGIFDGHGKHGLEMASISASSMLEMLEKVKIYDPRPNVEISKRFTKAFLHASKSVSKSEADSSYSGTTATAVVFDKKLRTLKIAHVGDTAVVLAKEVGTRIIAEHLTKNHTPDVESEMKRIQKKGGRVSLPKYDANGKLIDPARVWLQSGRVPGLAMSRSLGDLVAHSIGVSCEPEVSVSQVQEDALFLIIANAGLWQQISPQEAVHIIAKSGIAVRDSTFDAKSAAETLGEEAMKRWQAVSPDGVVDDITCIITKL